MEARVGGGGVRCRCVSRRAAVRLHPPLVPHQRVGEEERVVGVAPEPDMGRHRGRASCVQPGRRGSHRRACGAPPSLQGWAACHRPWHPVERGVAVPRTLGARRGLGPHCAWIGVRRLLGPPRRRERRVNDAHHAAASRDKQLRRAGIDAGLAAARRRRTSRCPPAELPRVLLRARPRRRRVCRRGRRALVVRGFLLCTRVSPRGGGCGGACATARRGGSGGRGESAIAHPHEAACADAPRGRAVSDHSVYGNGGVPVPGLGQGWACGRGTPVLHLARHASRRR
mmetsp:Transcript_23421/g.58050  ORF Transcript_23421/g.58050 Transcript_23421/m.58050 type:complete len:284 (-) Transcript_23421:2168-3019(-)